VNAAQAWSAVVSGEDAAIYAYSVAGARVDSGDRRQAQAGLESHRQRRSRAALLTEQAGASPPAGVVAFALPTDVDRPRGARRLLAEVENALVAVYADAAAAASGPDRRWAARAAADCAVAAVGWGAPPQAFPTSAQSGQ
jgi:Domain of unknown function (DUF4439)